MKISRWASRLGCSARHRVRCSATSGRSCSAAWSVFFKSESQPAQRHVHRRQAASDSQALVQFPGRRVGLLFHKPTQLLQVDLYDRRTAAGSGVCLAVFASPLNHAADPRSADAKQLGHAFGFHAAVASGQDTFT